MKLGKNEILYINALQQASNVVAKDCITLNKKLVYLVNAADMGKVIGKNGEIVKQLSQKMNKRIQIIAYYNDLQEFLEKMFNARIQKIEINENKAAVKMSAMDRRRIMLNRQKIDLVKGVIKRNYKVEELKIR